MSQILSPISLHLLSQYLFKLVISLTMHSIIQHFLSLTLSPNNFQQLYMNLATLLMEVTTQICKLILHLQLLIQKY